MTELPNEILEIIVGNFKSNSLGELVALLQQRLVNRFWSQLLEPVLARELPSLLLRVFLWRFRVLPNQLPRFPRELRRYKAVKPGSARERKTEEYFRILEKARKNFHLRKFLEFLGYHFPEATTQAFFDRRTGTLSFVDESREVGAELVLRFYPQIQFKTPQLSSFQTVETPVTFPLTEEEEEKLSERLSQIPERYYSHVVSGFLLLLRSPYYFSKRKETPSSSASQEGELLWFQDSENYALEIQKDLVFLRLQGSPHWLWKSSDFTKCGDAIHLKLAVLPREPVKLLPPQCLIHHPYYCYRTIHWESPVSLGQPFLETFPCEN